MSVTVPKNLVDEAWSIFDSPGLTDLMVKPSMPILFFGDLEGYFSRTNRFRTITVGINPSSAEFPIHNPFQRFGGPDMLKLCQRREAAFQNRYVAVLSNYFRSCPYEWFNSFDGFFEGMKCSFYGVAPALAVHTDLRSPLATNSAWGDMSRNDQRKLREAGEPLWKKLVEYLKPRAIILTVDPEPFYNASGWKVIYSAKKKKDGARRKRPYELRYHHDSETGADLFHAPMVNVPFGSITSEEKRMLGKKVLGRLLEG